MAGVDPVNVDDFPLLNVQKGGSVICIYHPSATKTAPPTRHSAKALQVKLRELIMRLEPWPYATVRVRSNRHQGSSPQTSFSPAHNRHWVETVAEPGIGTVFDRTRELSGGVKKSRMPTVSSPVTVFWKTGVSCAEGRRIRWNHHG